MELVCLLPVLLLVFAAAIDTARLIHFHQIIASLVREGGSLASRGSTAAQTIAALQGRDGMLDLQNGGRIIVTTIRRRSPGSPTPWVVDQTAQGGFATFASRVGAPGEAANVPGITALDSGVTMRAIEVVHRFRAAAAPSALQVAFPTEVYDVAYY
jgi:hypothetical protein